MTSAMNHLEAQSYIMPFIEGQLPDSKQLEFVMHMNTCKSCHDELEIYYTLINGMQQLDSKEELTGNYPKDLQKKLIKMEHHARGRRRIRMSTFSVVTVAIGLFMILFYGRCLSRVYDYEQETKASMQGQFYFARVMGDVILNTEDRMWEEKNRQSDREKAEKITIYDRVDAYLVMEQDSDALWSLGKKVVEEKAGTREGNTGEETTEETTE